MLIKIRGVDFGDISRKDCLSFGRRCDQGERIGVKGRVWGIFIFIDLKEKIERGWVKGFREMGKIQRVCYRERSFLLWKVMKEKD